jgi:tRNA modification GTPase
MNILRLSCKTGEGMQQLETAITFKVMNAEIDQGQNLIAINARHQNCLHRASDSLQRAIPMLNDSGDLTLISIELREALDSLGEISGKIDSDDILGVIFSRFCIGK